MRTGFERHALTTGLGPHRAFVPQSFINDPKHWRERAEEARVHAEQMNDPESKKAVLRIAEDYEKLAKRAEQRIRGER